MWKEPESDKTIMPLFYNIYIHTFVCRYYNTFLPPPPSPLFSYHSYKLRCASTNHIIFTLKRPIEYIWKLPVCCWIRFTSYASELREKRAIYLCEKGEWKRKRVFFVLIHNKNLFNVHSQWIFWVSAAFFYYEAFYLLYSQLGSEFKYILIFFFFLVYFKRIFNSFRL